MKEAYYEPRKEELSVGISRNMDFPAHFHESLELFYALNDGAYVTVGEQTKRMHAGDLALIFSNSIHAYASEQGLSEPTQAILAIVPLALTGEYRQLLAEMTPEDPFLPAEMLHPDVAYAISSLSKSESPPNLRANRALVQLTLSRTVPLLHLKKNTAKYSLLYQAVELISTSYREPLTLEDLSRKLGVSRYTLSRVFSEKIGCGFPEYVNRLRLNEAESLLLDSDLSITEISYHCGFETPRNFNRVFLRRRGITPREFRQREIGKMI
ncbi:MAG: helix-turn-helix domain-containing protein [Candidatus Merdivicinus sp.]